MELININMEFLNGRPLSYSALKEFRKSPKHYQMYLQRPRVQTEAMLTGSVVDCLLLEPEKFDSRYLIYEKPDLRTTIGKEKQVEFLKKAEQAKLTLLPRAIYDTACQCKQSVIDHDVARELIAAKKQAQVKLKWTHKETGIPMIGYVDFESSAWESDFIIDLKTANSSNPSNFIRDAAKLDYHIQVGAYMDGYPRCHYKFPNFAFLVVENEEPFNVSVMFCEEQYISAALEEFHSSMRAFKYCMDNNLWHMGYDFRMMGTKQYFNMELPGYLKKRYETSTVD